MLESGAGPPLAAPAFRTGLREIMPIGRTLALFDRALFGSDPDCKTRQRWIGGRKDDESVTGVVDRCGKRSRARGTERAASDRPIDCLQGALHPMFMGLRVAARIVPSPSPHSITAAPFLLPAKLTKATTPDESPPAHGRIMGDERVRSSGGLKTAKLVIPQNPFHHLCRI
jgi:hypothetical protein